MKYKKGIPVRYALNQSYPATNSVNTQWNINSEQEPGLTTDAPMAMLGFF